MDGDDVSSVAVHGRRSRVEIAARVMAFLAGSAIAGFAIADQPRGVGASLVVMLVAFAVYAGQVLLRVGRALAACDEPGMPER